MEATGTDQCQEEHWWHCPSDGVNTLVYNGYFTQKYGVFYTNEVRT